jgi:hypothetical protein
MGVAGSVGRYLSRVGETKFATGLSAITGIGTPNLMYVGLDSAQNLANGDSLGTSVAKGFASGALMASMTPVAAGMMALDAGNAYVKFKGWEIKRNQQLKGLMRQSNTVGGGYVDTQRALTMRQASIQAIQGSKLNARSALGGEARILSPFDSRRY